MKSIWKSAAFRVWAIVAGVLAVILIAATIAGNVPFIYNTLNSVLGGERRELVEGDPSRYMRYASDYKGKDATLRAANLLNETVCEEGFVLLKNEDETLPLTTEKKITVFGKNSADPVLGGSGSSAGGNSDSPIGLYDALENAGFEYNPVMKSFYENGASGSIRAATPGMGSILTGYPIGETPLRLYGSAQRESYSLYNEAALVVLTRIGGEGYDLPRTMFWNGSDYTTWTDSNKTKTPIPGARSVDDHYLQLDQNESDMLNEACGNFEKVIVILNSSAPLELGFLDDPNHYAYRENIKAALWIGSPGNTGANALGRILNGSVTPSGRTVDTYARDFTQNPTWNNFGNNRQDQGNGYILNKENRNAFFVEYREGIYVGYRYYETRGYTEETLENNPEWYHENVVYPFGYGMSYTTFMWDVGDLTYTEEDISVTVTVTNTGDTYSGKDVVQMYFTAPYNPKGEGTAIEKSHVVLGAFAKTRLLAPGESQDVTLTMKVCDMASYDYNDLNDNDFTGYELEAGDYDIKIMRDAHTLVRSQTFTLSEHFYKTDTATGNGIENLFDDMNDHNAGKWDYLSRADWTNTWPQPVTLSDRTVTQEFIDSLTYRQNDTAADPWYTDKIHKQSQRTLSYNNTRVKLYDLIGVGFGEEENWDSLLDQLTVSQMSQLIAQGNYRTININNIDKPLTTDPDGPMGFAVFMGTSDVYKTCYYAGECVMGATWNVELAHKMGRMIGNEGVIGNEKGDGRPYSGWYAPAVNLHRSQFSGRNFEYYSEDGLLSGKMAAEVIKGASSKGVYTYLKHFALNDQETDRDTSGLVTWANEQAMREIYFKPFEMGVKEGGTTAIMSSFNRMGTVWAGGDYRLLTELLRDEWGFRGMVVTDFNLSAYMNTDQMIRAGGDLNLSPNKAPTQTNTATSVDAIRRSAKNILYTVANSNAMNGMGKGVIYRYALPYWMIGLIVADIAAFVGIGGWGLFVIRRALKITVKAG